MFGRLTVMLYAVWHMAIEYTGRCGIRNKELVNRTQMTLATQIIADKTQKAHRESALSASSAFYQPVP
jgi:hypothetical protein